MNKITKKIILLITLCLFMGVFSVHAAQVGKASYYADKFDGRKTASGAIFRQNKLTAAHRKLPFGTRVRVTNLGNNKTVEVIINDRGPFSNNRIIDLSRSAANKLNFIRQGIARVRVEVLRGSKAKKQKTSKKSKFQKQPIKKVILTSDDQHNQAALGSPVSHIPKAEYYKVTTKKVYPTGFGIQVASYQESANLIKRCNDIKSKTNKTVVVKISETNGQKVYRIIVGNFSTRQQAENYNKYLKSKFQSGFIVSF